MGPMIAADDTQRLNWLLAQLGLSRDDLDWSIDQDGSIDPEMGMWPHRSSPWSPERAAVMERMKQVRAMYPHPDLADFLGEHVFPVIPHVPPHGVYHFRKATA